MKRAWKFFKISMTDDKGILILISIFVTRIRKNMSLAITFKFMTLDKKQNYDYNLISYREWKKYSK